MGFGWHTPSVFNLQKNLGNGIGRRLLKPLRAVDLEFYLVKIQLDAHCNRYGFKGNTNYLCSWVVSVQRVAVNSYGYSKEKAGLQYTSFSLQKAVSLKTRKG